MLQKIKQHQFLFEELVKRDFKKKYKRTVLGMLWSVLNPLLHLLVLWLVFGHFFGRSIDHFVVYLFSGRLVYGYFTEATGEGMRSLMDNAKIFIKVNIPKYLFVFSKNISSLISFLLTLVIYFFFVIGNGLAITPKFILLIVPIGCLALFNLGVGLILSALFVFFRDIEYLWRVFTQLLMYLSAIFYSIESYPPQVQNLFLLNPIYLFIRYFRKIVIESAVPSIWFHLLLIGYTFVTLIIGLWMYKKYNTKFLYYV